MSNGKPQMMTVTHAKSIAGFIGSVSASNMINNKPSAKIAPCVRRDTCADKDCKNFIWTSLYTRTGLAYSGNKTQNNTIIIQNALYLKQFETLCA